VVIGRSRAYLSILLAVAMLCYVVPSAFGATQQELEEHRQRAADARAEAAAAQAAADELRGEVEQLDEKIASLESRVAQIGPEIEQAASRTQRLNAEVERLRAEITVKEADITATQAEYERQRGLLDNRMTSSYKQGALYYLDLLLDAQSISDFIARTTLVQRVIEDNQEIALGLATTRDQLTAAKEELSRTLETVSVKRKEAEVAEARLRDLRAQRQAAVNEQVAVQDTKTTLMEENAENAERLRAIAEEEEAESARIEAELRSSSSSGAGVYNGVMTWPVPGFYRITSPYGWRTHPIFGTRKLHTGIDIGRNVDPEQSIDGASIVAAGDGEVVYAGYRGGYGNTVIIDHGDGVTTLYAHQQSGGIAVSEGDWVTEGVHIGRVGSTGYSTGPHLHFEVRVNGTPTDPMPYLQ